MSLILVTVRHDKAMCMANSQSLPKILSILKYFFPPQNLTVQNQTSNKMWRKDYGQNYIGATY